MTRTRGARLLALLASIVAVDATWLTCAQPEPERDGFARATCGLGLGAATSPQWSLFGVDPRLAEACEAELFPLPGLPCPDPTHGSGASRFLPRR